MFHVSESRFALKRSLCGGLLLSCRPVTSHVYFQVVRGVKSFLAHDTFIRSFSGVNPVVCNKSRLYTEVLATVGATKWTLACVNSLMDFKPLQRNVFCPAVLAVIGSFARVQSCMDQKGARVGKGFSTFTTQVRFLPFVHSDVLRQRVRLVKFLITKLTGIRALPGVDSQMSFQHFWTRKPLAAEGTNVRLHFGVSLHVLLKAPLRLEGLLTFVTAVQRLVCRMFGS